MRQIVGITDEAYQEREEEFLKNKALALLNQGQSAFKSYLKKKGLDPEKISDEKAEKILDEL